MTELDEHEKAMSEECDCRFQCVGLLILILLFGTLLGAVLWLAL